MRSETIPLAGRRVLITGAARGIGAALARRLHERGARVALAGIEPVLRRTTIPVRIVWGRSDRIFSLESPGYLDRTFSGSRGVRWLPDRKLFWPEELPEVVAQEARRLWSG